MSFTLTYGDRKSLRAIFDSQYASSETNPPAAMFLDDGPFLVELFPNDWKLPGLKAALDSQHVRQLLSESSLPSPSDKDPLSVDSKIFRYIPHRRCLINYEIRGTSIDHHLVGKLFATPEGASRSYETLTLLAANKATADCAPRPITLDQALGLCHYGAHRRQATLGNSRRYRGERNQGVRDRICCRIAGTNPYPQVQR